MMIACEHLDEWIHSYSKTQVSLSTELPVDLTMLGSTNDDIYINNLHMFKQGAQLLPPLEPDHEYSREQLSQESQSSPRAPQDSGAHNEQLYQRRHQHEHQHRHQRHQLLRQPVSLYSHQQEQRPLLSQSQSPSQSLQPKTRHKARARSFYCDEPLCVWGTVGFDTAADLLHHKRGVHAKFLNCEHCGRKFSYATELNAHQSFACCPRSREISLRVLAAATSNSVPQPPTR